MYVSCVLHNFFVRFFNCFISARLKVLVRLELMDVDLFCSGFAGDATFRLEHTKTDSVWATATCNVGSITSRCSGKEPAFLPLSGRDADQKRESGVNRAYLQGEGHDLNKSQPRSQGFSHLQGESPGNEVEQILTDWIPDSKKLLQWLTFLNLLTFFPRKCTKISRTFLVVPDLQPVYKFSDQVLVR